ncbi:MAG: alpha/beta hydrolase [Desulfobacterales bacterium]|nr:MAG: alpha/beta hydrolase [Desulfobacterales bacterium]
MAYLITILFVLVLIALIAYSSPVRRIPFQHLYTKVPEEIRRSLQTFRKRHKLKNIEVDGKVWNYLSIADSGETILFLHGMAGAYDIWWQVVEALGNRFKIICVTYPPVDSLEGLSRGILSILENEQVSEFNVVGSSLGGYLAQYLVHQYPHMIKKAVFANTFPPNDIIAQKTSKTGNILPYLPEWAVMLYLRQSVTTSIYPASGNSEIVLAYMMEQSHGMMTKKQFIARYHCILDHFEAPVSQASKIPVLVIEADNDPLVEGQLREMLKATYPSAQVKTLHNAGHFPYLNQPEQYTHILLNFLTDNGLIE